MTTTQHRTSRARDQVRPVHLLTPYQKIAEEEVQVNVLLRAQKCWGSPDSPTPDNLIVLAVAATAPAIVST